MSDLSESEKQTFLAATNRRKAAGIRLKRFTVACDGTQVVALNELFDAWVERFGKNKAVDHLISMWSRVEARLRDADASKASKD